MKLQLQEYIREQKSMFENNEKAIRGENLILLKVALIVMLAIFLLSAVSTPAPARYAYIADAVFAAVMLLIYNSGRMLSHALPGLYILAGILFMLLLYVYLFLFSDQLDAGAAGLYCLVPLIILDKSMRINCFMLACFVLHTVLFFLVKPANVAALDLFNGIWFLAAGLLLGFYIRSMRLKNFELIRQTMIQAKTDFLTGLYNRRMLDETTDVKGVLMIDIDDFKLYNDRYGHLQGDLCLQKIGLILKEICVETDCTPFRYGGEEFAVVCRYDSKDKIKAIAHRIRKQVWEQNLTCPDGNAKVTVSIGCASGAAGTTPEILKAADSALYRAKAAGKNTVMYSWEKG